MTSLVPVEIPSTTAGTTMRVALVYRYLMVQPDHWLRQAFFIGRPKLPVSRVVEAMQANGQNLEAAARDWALPVAAITEALDYYQRFHDVIEADATEDLALSATLDLSNAGQTKRYEIDWVIASRCGTTRPI